MKSSTEDLQGTRSQDAQQVSAPDPELTTAEWTSDCLLTLHSQVRFTRTDWP
ncbi:hypothetical protein [Pseudarthrobacter sp. YAF2]|uniref:hypothetical protein n=1 Tax=Pseudarthrobacter sp. YAF2 TaxID=3233078 RepID=UPI003F9C7051